MTEAGAFGQLGQRLNKADEAVWTYERRNADSYTDHVDISQPPRLVDQCLQAVLCRQVMLLNVRAFAFELVVPLSLLG